MARKFLTNIDLGLNQLWNHVLQLLGSDPGSPVEGQIWYNSGSHNIKYYNGSGIQTVGTSSATGTVTSVSVASANGFAGGVATATTTPAITISTSVTGLLKGNGTAVSAAAAGTDYAPATSGTSILKGNGSGGFSSAAAGTDYAPATSGTSALKGNGSGGFGTATINDLGSQTADYSANSHKITGLADPASAQDAATKNYVDASVQGLQVKPTATVVATSALPAGTYANGSSGAGATFTVTATGTTTVDGHVLAANDLVLLTAQASAFQNGLYTVTTAGTTGVSTVLTRHTDMDKAAEFSGALVPVGSTGTSNANSLWLANPSGTVTVGTTSIPFTELNKAADLIAGAGIALSGNTVSIENSGVLTVAHGGTGAAALTGLVKGNGTSAMTAAVSGTDYVVPSGSITGNAATATKLQTGRTINGVSFDGSASITIPATVKYATTVGDGSSTSIAVTHSLGTRDVVVAVYDASTFAEYDCDITRTSTSAVTLGFTAAPALNSLNVVVIG